MKPIYAIMQSKTDFDETVNKILQRPQYSHLRKGLRDQIESLKEAIGKWLEEMFLNLFDNDISVSPTTVDNLSTVAVIIGMILILAMIIYIVIKLNKTFEKKKKVKEILGEVIDEKTTPTSLRKKAAMSLEEGDSRRAVRYDFIALLLLMNNLNLVYLDETKTNEEIYQYLKVKEFPKLENLRQLITVFNSSWYGHRQVSQEEYQEWNSSLEELWNGVMSHEK